MKIPNLNFQILFVSRNPLAQMEEEKREHELKMKKMEAEMEQVFEMKVKEKKQKLKDSELELTRRHEERKKVCDFFFYLERKFFNFFFFCEFRLSKFPYANWKIANDVSNKRNRNGKTQMVSPWMN